MNTWKHKEWKTFKGIWMITALTLTDTQIQQIIWSNPSKYGSLQDWHKIS